MQKIPNKFTGSALGEAEGHRISDTEKSLAELDRETETSVCVRFAVTGIRLLLSYSFIMRGLHSQVRVMV